MVKKDKTKILLPIIVLFLISSLVIFVVSLILSNPTKLGPGGVTFWFIDVLILAVTSSTLLLNKIQKDRQKYRNMSYKCLRDSFRSALIIGVAATVLLALSSLRSLSWRDFLLFVILIAVIEVYFRTRRVSN